MSPDNARTDSTSAWSAEQRQALREMAASFAEREIAPRVAEYDRTETMPRDILEKMAELGFFGGVIAPEWGGLGLDHVTLAELIEEISRFDQTLATIVSMPSGLVGGSINQYGTAEQKRRWLVPLASGKIFGSAAVTEPYSGSDVAGMETTYRREGDEFVIRGGKAWISNLDLAAFILTFASFDRSLRHRGISAFIIPRTTPGLELRPYKDKFGFRPLCTGEVVLNDVRLGPEALLGEEGQGFRVAMTAVERGRLGVAARAVGVIRACLEDCVSYANQRVVFGQPIGHFQLVQSKITDMTVGYHTARLLVREYAEALDRGERARQVASMAKMYASDVAFKSAGDAAQIFGAYAVSPDNRIGRLMRDAKVLQIVEGSNDIHRALIAEIELGLKARETRPTSAGAG